MPEKTFDLRLGVFLLLLVFWFAFALGLATTNPDKVSSAAMGWFLLAMILFYVGIILKAIVDPLLNTKKKVWFVFKVGVFFCALCLLSGLAFGMVTKIAYTATWSFIVDMYGCFRCAFNFSAC